MSRVSQRVQIGLVLLLLSLALVFPVHSWASAPITRKSGPGFYRVMLGDFEITVISDGTFREPVDTLLTNTTKAVVDQELKENFESSPYEMSDNCFVVNTGRKLILIDTGAGSLMGPTLGHLLPNLAAAGYRPEQVDEVYITHLHPDHIGGLAHDGQRTFPNAILRIDQADVDYWLSGENLARASEQEKPFFQGARDSVVPYKNTGKLKTFSGDGELSPGISSEAAHGHTPGHSMYEIQSHGQTLEIIGDLVHVVEVQFAHPDVSIVFDSDSAMALNVRKKFLLDASEKGILLGSSHVSFPGLGHVRRESSGYAWIPVHYKLLQ
jgi:glyoxylase-like metal-dependent hydrolase (beta-lactamase superfamily II)